MISAFGVEHGDFSKSLKRMASFSRYGTVQGSKVVNGVPMNTRAFQGVAHSNKINRVKNPGTAAWENTKFQMAANKNKRTRTQVVNQR